MTDAIGPGARLRYVGYRGTTETFYLVLGRIYTVDEVYEADTLCACCLGRDGISLVGVTSPLLRADVIGCWCPCGFRPVGGDDAVLKQFATEPTKVKEPA